jgi:hypothetical protein
MRRFIHKHQKWAVDERCQCGHPKGLHGGLGIVVRGRSFTSTGWGSVRPPAATASSSAGTGGSSRASSRRGEGRAPTAISMTTESLRESCCFLRTVVSSRGSRFLLCELSKQDRRFPRYPPQPVTRCRGYARPQANGGEEKESPE